MVSSIQGMGNYRHGNARLVNDYSAEMNCATRVPAGIPNIYKVICNCIVFVSKIHVFRAGSHTYIDQQGQVTQTNTIQPVKEPGSWYELCGWCYSKITACKAKSSAWFIFQGLKKTCLLTGAVPAGTFWYDASAIGLSLTIFCQTFGLRFATPTPGAFHNRSGNHFNHKLKSSRHKTRHWNQVRRKTSITS